MLLIFAEKLTSVKIGPDVKSIGHYAFRDTAVTAYEIAEGNTAFKVQTADYILSADEKTLVAVAAFSNARKWIKGDKTIRSYEWTR